MTGSANTLSPSLPSSLPDLHADVWHAHALAGAPVQVQSTGHALLDAELPGGGWPVGALTEILQPASLHAEWRLLLPALVRCGQGPVVLVGAPHAPLSPALAAQGLPADRLVWLAAGAAPARLWAAEQALRCAAVDAVLLWCPSGAHTAALRRLQMAAAEHRKLLFVLRPASAQAEASPAVLRLLVQAPDVSGNTAPGNASPGTAASGDVLQVRLLKRRGPVLARSLPLPARAPHLLRLLTTAREVHALDRTAAAA